MSLLVANASPTQKPNNSIFLNIAATVSNIAKSISIEYSGIPKLFSVITGIVNLGATGSAARQEKNL